MDDTRGGIGGLLHSGLLPQFLLLNFAVWLHSANSMLAATTAFAVQMVAGSAWNAPSEPVHRYV